MDGANASRVGFTPRGTAFCRHIALEVLLVRSYTPTCVTDMQTGRQSLTARGDTVAERYQGDTRRYQGDTRVIQYHHPAWYQPVRLHSLQQRRWVARGSTPRLPLGTPCPRAPAAACQTCCFAMSVHTAAHLADVDVPHRHRPITRRRHKRPTVHRVPLNRSHSTSVAVVGLQRAACVCRAASKHHAF